MEGRVDIYHTLAGMGFLVLAYDQVGFGIRLPDMPTFYTRYPNSSRMARAVADVSAAVDFLCVGNRSRCPRRWGALE